MELEGTPTVRYVKWKYRRGYRPKKRKYNTPPRRNRKKGEESRNANGVVKEQEASRERSEGANGVVKEQEASRERSESANGVVKEQEASRERSETSAADRLSSPQHRSSSGQCSDVDPVDAEMDIDASLESSSYDISPPRADHLPNKKMRNEEISSILSASPLPEVDFTSCISLGSIECSTTPAAERQKKKRKSSARSKKRTVPLGLLKWRLNRKSSTQPGSSDLQFSNDPVVAENDDDASATSSGCDTSLPTAEHYMPNKIRGRKAKQMETLHQSYNPVEGNYSLKKIVSKYKYFMCRLCLCKSGTLVDIHGCYVGSGYVPSALISGLLQFEVSVTDIYPQLVCLECLKTLTVFQKFKDSCWIAKVKFDTLHFRMALPNNDDTGGMCDDGVNMAGNYEGSMETNEEYSNLCTEEQMEEETVSEIDIKEEPIEESNIRDPLRLESPHSDVGEIPKEDITIKEEEIQINQILSVEDAPVTIIEKTEKIAVPQVNSCMEREETQGSLFVKQTDTTSTKYLYEDISSAKEANSNPNEVNSKLPKENNLVRETIVTSEFCKASSSSICSFHDGSSIQPDLQGHIQSSSNMEEVDQNGVNVVDGVQMRKESQNYAVDEVMVGERVQNSPVDGRNQCKNLIEDERNNERDEEKTSSVVYFCKKCCKIFGSVVELDSHTCATEVKNFECKVCGKKFKTKHIPWTHIRKHNLNMRFYCQICCEGFLNEKELSKHFYFHKNNSLPQPVTASSPVPSISLGGDVNHSGQIQRNSNQEELVPSSNDATNSMKKQIKIPKLLISKTEKACPICHRIYCSSQYLNKHMLTLHPRINFEWTDKCTTDKGVEWQSIGLGDDDPYDCDVCGARFYMEDDLLIHMSVHARNNPFQCDCCGKKYNHKRLLWAHVAQCHKK